MDFVVEDGSGVPGANSYARIDEADAYFMDKKNHAWLQLDRDEKKERLTEATQLIEATYDGEWRGDKLKGSQGLSWPRQDSVNWIPSGVPTVVQFAVFEACMDQTTLNRNLVNGVLIP